MSLILTGITYVQQVLDAYTNTFDSSGQRTTGTGESNFTIVGPGWNSSLPTGLQVIKPLTNTIWIIGGILVKGESDLPNVLPLQKQFTLINTKPVWETSSRSEKLDTCQF
jgi:hypothetical protein